MHDKPKGRPGLTTDNSSVPGGKTGSGDIAALITELEAADPATAPDIAESIAARLEAGLGATDGGETVLSS